MEETKVLGYIKEVLKGMPADWLNLTTHRLDIYDEQQAKVQFLEELEGLFTANNAQTSALETLPTAFDYIRLGHPISCVLEWTLGKMNQLPADNVISFSSKTTPILAVLRKNLIDKKNTRIVSTIDMDWFASDIIKNVYGYQFELITTNDASTLSAFDGSTLLVSEGALGKADFYSNVDFFLNIQPELGSVLFANENNRQYISEIQHVRRRETIAMTPANAFSALQLIVGQMPLDRPANTTSDKQKVLETIREVTGTDVPALVASSGLSMQYAIVMGLIHEANEQYPGKPIKIVVPPNCYGGTNDQARRVAACLKNVEVMDLPVDGGQNMVQSIGLVLEKIADEDGIPYIIAEIPTNPRVEVPDLVALEAALGKKRSTKDGRTAIDPVFILDQTFCPNVHFLGDSEILSNIRTIAYVSGSKFPSGGKCTAGYCVANKKSAGLMEKIGVHLELCDNAATDLQLEILAQQLPSMNQRISDAYKNTRDFVAFIEQTLPAAKINFVSEALAEKGFTPSVFSLDLPTKGATDEERETYKRALNLTLINKMIERIPNESKYCVSYGQLKGCYWTIPATSTQGTTKEGDKDYIARVALSPNMDLELHKQVFLEFVQEM